MHYKMYINGEWRNAESGKTHEVINPGTEEVIAEVPLGSEEDARAAIDAARSSFDKETWSSKTPGERANVLLKIADMLERNAQQIAELESMNQGKTIRYSKESDMPFIIDNLRFFAGAARMLEGKASSEYTGLGTSIIRREPVGVVGAIVPWNYPLSIAVWKIAPALAAGNSVVIKPASLTPLTLLEFARMVDRAGVPEGVLNVVTGPGEIIGSELARSEKVDMISLTGDTSTGKEIMKLASSNVKKVHLELGGKAPMIIYEDSDIETAVQGAMAGGFFNNGQDCTAATRIIVQESIYYRFAKALADRVKTIRIGDQMDIRTDMGPMVSMRHLERVEGYIQEGKKEGAKLMAGGGRPNMKKGFFIEPTIFADATPAMKICQEEIFGPVLALMKFSTMEEAIQIANGVVYGLASSVFTRDITKAIKTANKLRFGTVWINDHGVLASEMPHGGFKQSGFGKDLSLYAMDEYTNIKHVYIDTTGAARKPWYYTVFGEK